MFLLFQWYQDSDNSNFFVHPVVLIMGPSHSNSFQIDECFFFGLFFLNIQSVYKYIK